MLIIANFLGYAIVGANGVLSLGRLSPAEGRAAASSSPSSSRERARLAHRAELLDPRSADPDLADEMVRRELGLVRPDEVIIPIQD